MVDRDFLAIEYSRLNASQNGIDNAEIYLSNGFSAVPESLELDLVVSNLPAKVGNEMFRLMFHDAHQRMRPGARIVVVTVNGLRDFVKRNFRETFGNYGMTQERLDARRSQCCLTRADRIRWHSMMALATQGLARRCQCTVDSNPVIKHETVSLPVRIALAGKPVENPALNLTNVIKNCSCCNAASIASRKSRKFLIPSVFALGNPPAAIS